MESVDPAVEGWVERIIREAVERGEFDHLEDRGKPLEILAEPYDPLWWVKRWVRREELSEVLGTAGERRTGPDDKDR